VRKLSNLFKVDERFHEVSFELVLPNNHNNSRETPSTWEAKGTSMAH